MTEALDGVKLEEPTEETPAAGEAPTTENAESEQATTEGAGPKDGQPAATAKAEDSANDPFHKRPEWAELNKALGDDGAKKARPIIRQLMEREHRAAEAIRPLKQEVDELRRYTVDDTGYKTMKNVVRAYAEDPAAAVPVLEKMLLDARTRSGHVVSSPDLKAKLATIDKKLENGQIDEETANLLRESVTEAEKGRAGARTANERQQQTETQRRQQAQMEARGQALESINSWETNIRERDPDFGQVTPVNDPKHGESVADRVFDALQLKFMNNPRATADELIAEATRVHRLARGQLARPAAREQRPVTSSGSSTTAKPKPKTMREAMDAAKLD